MTCLRERPRYSKPERPAKTVASPFYTLLAPCLLAGLRAGLLGPTPNEPDRRSSGGTRRQTHRIGDWIHGVRTYAARPSERGKGAGQGARSQGAGEEAERWPRAAALSGVLCWPGHGRGKCSPDAGLRLPRLPPARRRRKDLYAGGLRRRAGAGGDVHLQPLPLRSGGGGSAHRARPGARIAKKFSSWPSAPTMRAPTPTTRSTSWPSAGARRRTASPICTTNRRRWPEPSGRSARRTSTSSIDIAKLAYRGRIDDSWKEPAKVTRRDLADAISALLQGAGARRRAAPLAGLLDQVAARSIDGRRHEPSAAGADAAIYREVARSRAGGGGRRLWGQGARAAGADPRGARARHGLRHVVDRLPGALGRRRERRQPARGDGPRGVGRPGGRGERSACAWPRPRRHREPAPPALGVALSGGPRRDCPGRGAGRGREGRAVAPEPSGGPRRAGAAGGSGRRAGRGGAGAALPAAGQRRDDRAVGLRPGDRG